MLDSARTQFYYLGISLLLVHEMDAVMHAEWRLLYGLRDLGDATAYPLFLLLHVPLVLALLTLANHPRSLVREGFRAATAGFLVVHATIHLHVSSDPAYTFEPFASTLLIFGAAAAAAAWGLLSLLRLRWRGGVAEED